MKKIIFIYLFLTLNINLVLCQNFGEHEIVIANYTNSQIWVKLYPVSAIINGKPEYDYTVVGLNQSYTPQHPEESWNYINGTNQSGSVQGQWTIVSPSGTQGYNFDNRESPGFAHSIGNFGFGVYKIIVSYTNPSFKLTTYDTVLVDYDLWDAPH